MSTVTVTTLESKGGLTPDLKDAVLFSTGCAYSWTGATVAIDRSVNCSTLIDIGAGQVEVLYINPYQDTWGVVQIGDVDGSASSVFTQKFVDTVLHQVEPFTAVNTTGTDAPAMFSVAGPLA